MRVQSPNDYLISHSIGCVVVGWQEHLTGTGKLAAGAAQTELAPRQELFALEPNFERRRYLLPT